ncbi:MAG: AAA family ATPase, partial [Eubacteriales bacterium]|nr:AAA family ATPase [Eubacteriales bacterium]
MYFKRLEIHGFKSFADPVVIDFKEGITAIVGPNGSGKSNISDAIRWVLGEQSPKELRGGKMDEVIFNGTENRRPRGMAEVTLVIDNSSGFLKIDYSEVAVTRRMYRNGDSEYLINGNSCRLKDIRELFVDTGIGVDGYSIIGQGKIQDIVSNKSESRREIFEESAGVNTYLTKKEESERKLEKTSQNLERVQDLASELSDRVEKLKTESAKAKKYISLKKRYEHLSVNIILKNIEQGQELAAKLKNDAADLAGQIHFTENNQSQLSTELADCDRKIVTLDRLMRTTQDKIPEVAEALSRIRKEKEFNRERLRVLEKESKQISEELSESESKILESNEEYERLKERQNELRALLRQAENDLEEKEQRFKQISKGSGGLDKIVSDGNDRLFSLHSFVASKKSERKSLASYKQALERRKNEIAGDTEQL